VENVAPWKSINGAVMWGGNGHPSRDLRN
jgi:hypothetical protein